MLIAAAAVAVGRAPALGSRVPTVTVSSLGVSAHGIGDDAGLGDVAGAGRARGAGAPVVLADAAAELDAALGRLAENRPRTAATEESRRELVAWVAHDLRAPLAAIGAMVEALEDGLVDDAETVARYYRTIRGEADRLAGLVDDLLELSSIHTIALNRQLERVAIDEVVSDVVAAAAITAEAKGVELCGEVGAPVPVVELSIRDMARVVRNLLDNAIRHTPPGGRVRIEASTEADGCSAVVSVRDGCGGIPALDLPRVFEMAYRGDAARAAADGGAGLGLAVARGLVEAHHGEISVANEHGGCCFTVRLPAIGE